MKNIDFITQLHGKTSRDYVERVIRGDKAHCAEVAKQFGRDYWDGDRKYGYGGYSYDGRWAPVARDMIDHYGLTNESGVLDVGCGKAHLLHEMKVILPGLGISGLDVSEYAIANAKEEVREFLDHGKAQQLPYPDNSFDLLISITTLHNLPIDELEKAIKEIERVKKANGNSYIVVESYRNEQEKDNMLNWQLTCESFFTPQKWEWVLHRFGYTGDYSFIFFE